ncbi:MAG TPA: type II TA system antitoxin MqsA family protein [Candidatus Acidoferrum sp.]|nr:type II TA system antitoxin MqsA family protein [Candidatus Acidoferrum sp.]
MVVKQPVNASAEDHDCRKTSKKIRATFEHPYRFVQSGLSNVFLVGIDYYVCEECGKQSADIPALNDLMMKIARVVVSQEARLDGNEIRFLRKRLRKKAIDFGKIIGVTAEQISRWENDGNPPSESADKLIRVFFCLLSGDAYLSEKVNSQIDAWLETLPGVERSMKFNAELRDHQWDAEAVPA